MLTLTKVVTISLATKQRMVLSRKKSEGWTVLLMGNTDMWIQMVFVENFLMYLAISAIPTILKDF